VNSRARWGRAGHLRWVIVFVVLFVGAIVVSPVLADSPQESEPGGSAGAGSTTEIPTIAPGEIGPGGSRVPTEAQMQATLLHGKEKAEEAAAELETPQAQTERETSQTAYEGASPAEAEGILRSQFGESLAELNADPARLLSDAKLDHVYGKYAATVTSEGETTVMQGTMPILAGEGSEQKKVDIGLEESSEGWATENPLVPVTIGKTAEEGVEVGERMTITQHGVEEVEGTEFGDKNVFFGEVSTDTDQLVSPTARGVELFDQLRSPASPTTLHFKVGLPAGATLQENEGGAIVVGADGGTLASIPAPSALDAQGATIPIDFTVEGDTIVLTLQPEGEPAYPILVDPEIDENLQWAWYSGNTAVMGNWVWAPGNSSGWLVPGYGDGSWPGIPGLFMWSNPGNLPGGSWGEWILSTPNTATYMTSVTVSPLYRNNAGCSAPNPYFEPYDFEGLFDGTQWDPIQFNQANEHGWAQMGGVFNPGWGKQLIIGMETTSGTYIPCYRHIMIGGFEAWLGDWASPIVYTPSGVPTGWMNASSAFTLSVPAYDEGLGVAKTWMSPEGAPPIPSSANCTGGYRSLCPHSFTGTYALNGTLFDQGEHTSQVSAESPTLKGSGTYTFTTKVDRSPPEIALSNQLAEATRETLAFGQAEKPQAEGDDQLSLPTYNLTVEARDGSLASPATKRSGVKEIEVELVGTTQKWKYTKASCPETSCSLSGTAQIKLTEALSAGLHKVKIYATDFVGNKETREIEFEYMPATGIDGNGVLQRFPLPDGNTQEGHIGPELAVNVVNGNLVFHQRDVNVEGPEANLEIERFYNSQLSREEGSEWGRGWTLSQTPVLGAPTASPGGTPKPHLMSTSSVNAGAMTLPAAGQSHYTAALHAMVAAESGGGYAITESDGDTTMLNSAGKTTEVQTGPYSSVNYNYSGGKLSEVAVEDLASTTLPPSAYATTTVPVSTAPTFLSSFGAAGTGNGQFSHPSGIARDAAGNVWVVDKGNNRVEEFNESGTFVKAIGTAGTGNGQFSGPKSIAFSAAGNFWVADAGNNRLEEFNAAGEFLKAVGSLGSGNGQFNGPESIAIAPTGEIWVADTYNFRIQVLNEKGEFLRLVNPSALGQIEPTGVTFAPGGKAWVADWSGNRVVEFTEAGEIVRQIGTSGAGTGQFARPDTVTVDNQGNLWVVDQNNERVQEFNSSGGYLTQFGAAGSGTGQFSFGYPTGIVTDTKGDVWVSDSNNNRVQRWVTAEHGPVFQGSFGATGAAGGQFSHPAGIARDIEGNLWVADYGNNRIEKFGPTGTFLAAYGSSGTAAGKFSGPKAIAFDNDGNYWVADSGNSRLEQFDASGGFLRSVGALGAGNGQFTRPESLTIAPNGDIWVADTYNYRIEVLNEKGEFLRIVNPAGMGAIEPTGITFGPDGKVWVADWAHNRVIELTQSGELVRTFGSAGTGNGQFAQPDTIAVDRKGGVWVVDQNHGRVQEFNQNGEYVAQFGAQGSGTGQFSFSYPTGIVTDRAGDIWVADANNNRIQRWRSADALPEEIEPPVPAHDDPRLAVATTAGYVSSVSGAGAGTCSYVHEGELLTSVTCPSGTTTYSYDTSSRLSKVTLPNGEIGEIKYDMMNRVTRVIVKAPGESAGKSTYFYWGNRLTEVEAPGQRATTYVIGNGGGVLKIYNSVKAPDFHDLAGTLYGFRETSNPIEPGDQNLVVEAHSVEGVASIKMIVNGSQLVDEKTCAQNYEVAGIECQIVPLEWVVNTAELSPGIMPVEIQLTDSTGLMTTERFWVNIPYAPPTTPGVPTLPPFKSIQQFREEYDLDPDLNYATEELAVHDRIFNLLGAWHNPQTPAGEIARASWERWGVPLRQVDMAELEYREWMYRTNAEKIEAWVEANSPANFAGDYLDNRAGGIMYVGFLGNQEEQLNQLKSSLGLVAPERVKVYPVAPTVSLLSARATAASVASAIEGSATLRPIITSISLEKSGTLVHVGATNVALAESTLASLVPGAQVVVVHEAGGIVLLSGRYRTEGRMRAGDAVFAHTIYPQNTKCTAGFGTKSKAGEKNGQPIWRVFTLTAGHCVFLGTGETFYRSTDADQENTSHWKPIGQVERGNYPAGAPITMDAAAIEAHTNGLVPQGQWGAGGTLAPTQPAGKVKVGETVCFSGITTTQLSCGPVTEITPYWNEGGHIAPRSGYWVKFSTPADHGDSGGPVWSIFGPAIGLIDAKPASGEKHTQDETFVEPLLTPLGLNRFVQTGLLENPAFAPMSLKVASDPE
jgi:tripartite motif-containing protein 71